MIIYIYILLVILISSCKAFNFAPYTLRSNHKSLNSQIERKWQNNYLKSSNFHPNELSLSATKFTSVDSKPNRAWEIFTKVPEALTVLFPVWTILFAGLALVKPSAFDWFSTKYFTSTLSILMLSMGITLKLEDFKRVSLQPAAVLLGFLLCYGLCPLIGFSLGKFFKLPLEFLAGLTLVGCVNGGQASNLCTYIARGDVALSILMTTFTTISGIFVTPLLCKSLLGTVVPIDALGIGLSSLQVVLFPILLGISLNKYAPKVVEKLLPVAPVFGVISTCLLVGSSVAQSAPAILKAGFKLQFAVMLLHLLGGFAGYYISKYLKFTEVQSRTMAIETAMKSSAFAFLLAKLHFKNEGVQVPATVSLVWMALVGATMAVAWRFIPVNEDVKK